MVSQSNSLLRVSSSSITHRKTWGTLIAFIEVFNRVVRTQRTCFGIKRKGSNSVDLKTSRQLLQLLQRMTKVHLTGEWMMKRITESRLDRWLKTIDLLKVNAEKMVLKGAHPRLTVDRQDSPSRFGGHIRTATLNNWVRNLNWRYLEQTTTRRA